MKNSVSKFTSKRLVLVMLIILFSSFSYSQDLEPRAYATVPKGINVLAVGYKRMLVTISKTKCG